MDAVGGCAFTDKSRITFFRKHRKQAYITI
jgi:hypothetical protein